jgi:signal peptidase
MLPQTATYTGTQPAPFLTEPQRRIEGRRPARLISSALLVSVVLLILAAVAGMARGAWRFTVIDTGSMRPTLNPGDVAVLTSERNTDLKLGQIVAVHPPGESRLTVMHRVSSVQWTRNGVVIQTKGDANDSVDPWRARIVGKTVWRESLKAPMVGYLAVWSQQRPIRLALVIVIVTLVVGTLLGWIWRPVSR